MKIEDFDIISYLQSRNVPFSYGGNNVSSGWIGINCLFCLDPSNHLGINLQSKAFSCFRCAEKGNAIKLIQEIDGVSEAEAWKIMHEYTNGFFIAKEKHYQSKVKFPPGTSKNFGEQHLSFLENRKYEAQTVIKQYDLYATGPVGDYKHRLLIPVFFKKRIVSFVGRDVTNQSKIKYKNSSEQYSIKDVKQCLYNMDSVIQDKAVIVEGVFDTWRIGDGAIATFGTKYTREQLRLLKGLKRVFILYDADAIPTAHKLAYDLTTIVPQIEVLELSEGDPDNLTEKDVRALRKDLNL
jgi:DNA primase